MKITIPTTWDDITLEKYINLRPVLNTEMQPVERVINTLCILTGEKKEVIRNISLEQYHELLDKMKFLTSDIPTKLKAKRFKVGGKYYEFQLDAKRLLFGEYINAMELLQDAANNEDVIFNNLHKILTTICRPVEKKRFKWQNVKIDGEVIRHTADNFYKNMPITIAYPIGVFFLQSLTELNGRYKNLFDAESKQDNKGSKEGTTGFTERWSWWVTLDNLTNSRVDKWDSILSYEVIKALNIVAYFSDKQKHEAQIHRDTMQKMKHR